MARFNSVTDFFYLFVYSLNVGLDDALFFLLRMAHDERLIRMFLSRKKLYRYTKLPENRKYVG